MTSTIRSVIAPFGQDLFIVTFFFPFHIPVTFSELVNAYFTFRPTLCPLDGSLGSASELVQEHNRWSSSSEAKCSEKKKSNKETPEKSRFNDTKNESMKKEIKYGYSRWRGAFLILSAFFFFFSPPRS